MSASCEPTRARGPYLKSGETKRRIIDAATAVFSELGYQGGSTAAVADRAGISSAQIFYHFDTKADLLDAVLRHRDRVADELAGPLPEDPREIPAAFLRIAADNDSVPGFISLYMTLVAESTAAGHPAQDYFRSRYRRLRERFEEVFAALEAAELLAPGVDARYAASSTLALWDGIQLQWLIEPSSIEVVEHLRRHLMVLMRAETLPG